jgi:septum formation protein
VPELAHQFVLASISPRRREILSRLGFDFRVIPSAVDELRLPGEAPGAFALRMASAKAEDVARRLQGSAVPSFVLGADTVVVIQGEILGKPDNDAEARRMLGLLSGREHEVITAVALRRDDSGYKDEIAVSTQVWFRELDAGAIEGYVASGEGSDKAGSYAIQGLGAGLVSRIEGSYSNVVGLPATHTLQMFVRAGLLKKWP